MQKYGKLVDGVLLLSLKQLDGYKPVQYAEIPADFNQSTQYAVQTAPVDNDDHIFVGIEMHDLPPEDEGMDEMDDY